MNFMSKKLDTHPQLVDMAQAFWGKNENPDLDFQVGVFANKNKPI